MTMWQNEMPVSGRVHEYEASTEAIEIFKIGNLEFGGQLV